MIIESAVCIVWVNCFFCTKVMELGKASVNGTVKEKVFSFDALFSSFPLNGSPASHLQIMRTNNGLLMRSTI